MASKVKAPAKRKAELSTAEQEAEKKRLAELRAAKRDDDDKDAKDDKKDDDDGADDERDEDEDEARDGDGSDTKDETGDDDDGADDKDKDDDDTGDGKRAASAVTPRSGALSASDVRKAAEAAVRADRIRGAKIREVAAQFGFPKLGERHANGETSVRAFKDIVLERLAERQKKRGNTTFAAAGTPELDDGPSGARQAPTAQAREMEKGAAEARALLGSK